MFPLLYHAHHSLHNEDLPFWLELARKSPGAILEAGCGTGRLLTELVKSGKRVIGIDLDFGMLSFLLQNTPDALPAHAAIFQADFTAFHLTEKFGLIILACNTYSTLSSDQRNRLLQRAVDHLRPDGMFAVSMPNPHMLRQFPRTSAAEVEEIFTHPWDGEPVQVSSEWQRNRRSLTIQWHYDHLLPDGRSERVSAHVTHALLSAKEYIEEAHRAGFDALQTLGDYDGSAFSPDSPYLILMARL